MKKTPLLSHLKSKFLHSLTNISSPQIKSTPIILKSKLTQNNSDPSLSLHSHDFQPPDRRSSIEQSSDQTCNGRFVLWGSCEMSKAPMLFPAAMAAAIPNGRRCSRFWQLQQNSSYDLGNLRREQRFPIPFP